MVALDVWKSQNALIDGVLQLMVCKMSAILTAIKLDDVANMLVDAKADVIPSLTSRVLEKF